MMIPGIDTQLLAATLAKGTILLIVAVGIAAALRRSPAGARHLVWLTTLATVLLFPALARWEPMRFEVLPPIGTAAADAFGLTNTPTPAPTIDATVAADARASADAPAAQPNRTRSSSPASRMANPAGFLLATWLAGALALLGWLGLGIIAVRRIVNGGRVLDDTRWTTPLYEVADRMNLDVVPRLIISERVEMPFACGIWHPTIVFPASADAWNDERRRVVLFHELAHIKRRDLVGHSLGRLACALYWFHPLVWTAAKQLRAESERACDDLVLACGARASDYVAHLLDIITSVKHAGAPVTALPMARKKEFEGRMLAILDPAIPRGAPGRLQSLGILAVLVLITLSVAAAAPARTPIEIAAEPSTPDPTQDLVPDAPRSVSIEPRPQPVPLSSPASEASAGILPNQEKPKVVEKVNPVIGEKFGQLVTSQVDQALKEASRIVRTQTTQMQRTETSISGSGKRNAALALAEQSSDRVEALVKILRTDDDEDVRRSAAWGLAQMRDARVMPALVEAFRKDKDENVREMAIWALAHLTDDAGIFIDALKSDASEEVRETAAWALGNMETHEGDAALIAALNDDSPEVRRTVIWAIGNLEPRQGPTALAPLLKDGDSEVRMMAAWALGQMLDPATAPALRAAFKTETDNEARQAEFRALALMGDVSSEFIDEAMKSKDPELRARAVRVLAGQGTGPWPWPWPWPRPRPSP